MKTNDSRYDWPGEVRSEDDYSWQNWELAVVAFVVIALGAVFGYVLACGVTES